MSSESNGRKPDSQAPGPPRGRRRAYERARAVGVGRHARRAGRGAQPRRAAAQRERPLPDHPRPLPELRTSAGVLREAFERSVGGRRRSEARRRRATGRKRSTSFDALLDATARADDERATSPTGARSGRRAGGRGRPPRPAGARRGARPDRSERRPASCARRRASPARRAGTRWSSGSTRPRPMRRPRPTPTSLGPLLSLLVAGVHAAGAAHALVRARCADAAADVHGRGRQLARRGAAHAGPARPSGCPASDGAVRRLAEQIGATLELDGRRGRSLCDPPPRCVRRPVDGRAATAPSPVRLPTEPMTSKRRSARSSRRAFADRALLAEPDHATPSKGRSPRSTAASSASPRRPTTDGGEWTTHAWVKEAILLYFALRKMEKTTVGPFEFHDKIPLKTRPRPAGVRVVPPGVARYGVVPRAGRHPDAGLRQHRRARRRRDDGRHLGHRRLVRADRARLPPRRRRRHRRRARAAGRAARSSSRTASSSARARSSSRGCASAARRSSARASCSRRRRRSST